MAAEQAMLLWDLLYAAGQEFGLEVGGYKVLDSLRLEKGYKYFTADVTPMEDPYSAGLGLPFLAMGMVLDRAVAFSRRLGGYVRTIQIGSGLVLVLVGILMITDRLTLIAIWAQRNGYFLDLRLGVASAPTMAAALIAGLVSFLSPCVLPLVPAYLGYLSGERVTHPA